MAAPILGCAKVTSDGTVKPIGPRSAPDTKIAAEDVQDTSKLAQFVSEIFRDIAALKARWYPRRIDFEDVALGSAGALTQLAHNFAGRVRWSVAGIATGATGTTEVQMGTRMLWIQRALFGALTIASSGINLTTGCRFQATSACSVMGVRFLWKSATRTVKVTLWRDSDGAVLGTGTVAVTGTGVYTANFTTPAVLSGANLNVDLTVGIYDQAGTAATTTGLDATFTGYLPLTLPGLLLKSLSLTGVGDTRPTTVSGAALMWAEPVLTPVNPQLIDSASTDSNTLALASYVPGTATVRIEESG